MLRTILDIARFRSRRQRTRVVAVVIPAFLGALLQSFGGRVADPDLAILLSVLAVFLFSLSGVAAVVVYLQTGFRFTDASDLLEPPHIIDDRFSRIEERLEELVRLRNDVSDVQRNELVRRVRQQIEETANSEFLDEIRTSIANRDTVLEVVRQLRNQYEVTVNRLNTELSALARRGNVNLALGGATAIAGVLLLWNFVLEPRPGGTVISFLENVSPRISLVFLVEVFAYFFLRLYSTSLVEIKYFQNEITNIEVKFVSLQTAVLVGTDKTVAEVLLRLVRTERNYVLRKGETTANLERSRMEKDRIAALTEKFLKVWSRR